MVPEWAQVFANSLKPLIQNLQHNQGQQFKQSVLFDTPMIKFNMMGSSIQSIQFLARSTEQVPKHSITREKITANYTQEPPQRESMAIGSDNSSEGRFAFSAHPVKNFYVRRRKKNTLNAQDKRDPPLLSTLRNKIIPVKLNKKRKASPLNDNISGQSLRRSSRLSNKNKGYKNRNILESGEGKGTRGNKMRKVTNPKELSDKIVIPAPIHNEEFPGLADLEGPTPFPEISTSRIQKVAINRCGISPSEVTTEQLLASEED
jgi:hypothetical protein